MNQREINNNNNNNHNNNKSIIDNLGNQTNNKNDTEGDENLGFMNMIREYGIVLNLGMIIIIIMTNKQTNELFIYLLIYFIYGK